MIDDKGNPKKAIEYEDYWYKQNYHITQQLLNTHLNTVFVEAIANGLIDFERVCEFIESRPLLRTPSEVLSFRRGLERLFVGDFVSALYILVPLYERVIINISEILNIDVIAINRDSVKDVSIQDNIIGSRFVASEEFSTKW